MTNELLQIKDYKVLAEFLNALDLKDSTLATKAMLYNHLVRGFDISEAQKNSVVERLFALYEKGENSVFRADIEDEANYACSAFENGENPYENE